MQVFNNGNGRTSAIKNESIKVLPSVNSQISLDQFHLEIWYPRELFNRECYFEKYLKRSSHSYSD